jgi:squalene synthase HpnC
VRDDLRAVYDVARFIDDVGDDPAVDPPARLRGLDTVQADLEAVFSGNPARLAVLDRLRPTVAGRRLPLEPFLDLVEANRQDQRTARYPTYADLVRYCQLSADPVGRIVLAVFDRRDHDAERLSDQVCTALQLLEHCQDVAEDLRERDRVYLPLEDLARFGVTEDDLRAAGASSAVRRLVGFEVDRAAQLLRAGAPLVSRLSGWARVAVTGYVAGGLATVDALRRAEFDVLASTPRPRRRDVLRHALRLTRGSR